MKPMAVKVQAKWKPYHTLVYLIRTQVCNTECLINNPVSQHWNLRHEIFKFTVFENSQSDWKFFEEYHAKLCHFSGPPDIFYYTFHDIDCSSACFVFFLFCYESARLLRTLYFAYNWPTHCKYHNLVASNSLYYPTKPFRKNNNSIRLIYVVASYHGSLIQLHTSIR